MKFGPAEMAQMMDGAKALLTAAMIFSVVIGIVLGVIVAFFTAFFRKGLDRNRAETRLTNGQLTTPNSNALAAARDAASLTAVAAALMRSNSGRWM
jgi:hypothetical protein